MRPTEITQKQEKNQETSYPLDMHCREIWHIHRYVYMLKCKCTLLLDSKTLYPVGATLENVQLDLILY